MPIRFHAFLLYLSFGICACQLRPPTLAEQKAFINRGGLPGEIPTWVPSSWNDTLAPQPESRSQSWSSFRPRTLSNGIIQLTHGSRQRDGVSLHERLAPDEAVIGQKQSIPESLGDLQESDEKPFLQEARRFSKQTLSPKSRVERIEEVCPGMGQQFIQKVDSNLSPAAEIRELSSLISLCPRSWDLWLLLGKSYERQNHKEEARRSFTRVLSLDVGNEEAGKALREVDK